MIDAMEGQEVATTNIPGDFLQTSYNKVDIHIKIEGAIVTLIEETNPDHYKYFIYIDKRGRKCMYVDPKKAIYDTSRVP